jgi:hypothetical protein
MVTNVNKVLIPTGLRGIFQPSEGSEPSEGSQMFVTKILSNLKSFNRVQYKIFFVILNECEESMYFMKS